MSDEASFLRAIIAEPADDTARLVYADWLDEHDQPERAEFIRVQIELARTDPFDGWECKVCSARPRYEDGFDLGEVEHGSGCYMQSEDGRGNEFIDVSEVYKSLRNREAGLLERFAWQQWQGACAAVIPKGSNIPSCIEFRRGFIASVTCTAADWLEHGDAIREQHPVTRVALMGMQGWDARVAQFDSHAPDGTFGCTRWPLVRFKLPPGGAPVPEQFTATNLRDAIGANLARLAPPATS